MLNFWRSFHRITLHKYKKKIISNQKTNIHQFSNIFDMSEGDTNVSEKPESPLIQYVLVRGDLQQTMKWPTGAVIAQACHACTAVIHLTYSHEDTQSYLADLDRMHKVVLQVKDEASLRKISDTLKEADVQHKLWIEQPEDIPTCIAVRPYYKHNVQHFFKGLKLFR